MSNERPKRLLEPGPHAPPWLRGALVPHLIGKPTEADRERVAAGLVAALDAVDAEEAAFDAEDERIDGTRGRG